MAQQLSDRDERLRRIFAAAKAKDTDYLIEALRDPDHRFAAALFLRDLGDVRAIPALMRLLDAHDPIVRTAAIRALGKLGAREAKDRLTAIAWEDPTPSVRTWAIEALAHIGGRDCVPLLISLLDDSQWWVRRSTANMLGWLEDPQALEALDEARRREGLLRRKPYRRAIRAIRQGQKRAR